MNASSHSFPFGHELKRSGPQALIALILGLIAISFAPILIRLSESEISPYATIFHRSWMATLIFLGLGMLPWYSSSSPEKIAGERRDNDSEPQTTWISTGVLLLTLGATFAVAVVSWAWALTQTTVANSTLLHSFTPLFTGLLAWMVWGQKFHQAFWIGMIVAMGGATLLGLEEFNLNPNHLWGDGASLFSAIFFSAEPLLVEKLRQRQVSTHQIMVWCFAIVTLLTLPVVLIFPDYAVPTTLNGWLTLWIMAIVCQAIGHGLLTFCLKYITAGIVSLSHLLVPLISALAAWRIFDEPLGWWNVITFGIILAGILISISDSNASPPESETAQKSQ